MILFAVQTTEGGNFICKKSANTQYVWPRDKRVLKKARIFKTRSAAEKFAATLSIDVHVVELAAAITSDIAKFEQARRDYVPIDWHALDAEQGR